MLTMTKALYQLGFRFGREHGADPIQAAINSDAVKPTVKLGIRHAVEAYNYRPVRYHWCNSERGAAFNRLK